MEPPNDAWLSTEEIGRELGMSSEWVRRQCVSGRLRSVAWKIGQRQTYRVRRSWLDAFIAEYRRDGWVDRG